MPTEKRTRVEIFLPLRSDLSSYKIVTDWLAEEFAFSRGGSTLTTPFAGLFSSATQVDIVEDAVRVLFCDFDFDIENEELHTELVIYLEGARQLLLEALEEEEIWIVFHSITRIVS